MVPGQQELQALPLSSVPATIREDCLALLPVLDTQIRRLDRDLQPPCQRSPQHGLRYGSETLTHDDAVCSNLTAGGGERDLPSK
jgi:hypothetical protein